MKTDELPDAWRARAGELEAYAPAAAQAFRTAAGELDAAIAAGEAELLTMPEAVAYSGYSADGLTKMVREGRLPNHGRKHAPRFKRSELPVKPPKETEGSRRVLSIRRRPGHVLGATPRQAAAAIAQR